MTLGLGEFLKRHRINAGLTLDELSQLSGITITALWNAENGKNKPYAKTIIRLAKILKFDETEVFKTYY